MSPITHFLIGWAVASGEPSLNNRERVWVTLASVAPDLDGLGIVAELATKNSPHPLPWWSEYHHVLGHNIGFALAFTALAACFASARLKTACLVFISFHLHLIGDLAGAKGPDGDQWPIPYLLPFSNAWPLVWRGQWPLNGWQNIVITAVLLGLALGLARRRGFSPLGMISAKLDGVVVEALRRRFPVT